MFFIQKYTNFSTKENITNWYELFLNDSKSNSLSEPGSTCQEVPSCDLDQDNEPEPKNSKIDSLSQEEEKEKTKEIFFRIWFGLSKLEIMKTAFGSIAAAFSGISKPIFGFFIITIGVAYYHNNAKHKVGLYALIFSLVGLLSLFTHTLQHYFFGVVGEKAMKNLREALYSGTKNLRTLVFGYIESLRGYY